LFFLIGPPAEAPNWLRLKSAFSTSKKLRESNALFLREFEGVAVKFVGARFEDGGDHAAGGSAVFGGVFVGQHTELAHRLDAEVDVQAAARTGVREVVDDESVDEKDVAGRPVSRDGERQAVAARGARIREGTRPTAGRCRRSRRPEAS